MLQYGFKNSVAAVKKNVYPLFEFSCIVQAALALPNSKTAYIVFFLTVATPLLIPLVTVLKPVKPFLCTLLYALHFTSCEVTVISN